MNEEGKSVNTKRETPKKKCFIITPIDNEGSPMRRHIEGIIDSAIIPVLEEEFEIIVAHRMYSPGSINKQVIMSIYESDLVVANLTGLNPNVMYELAFRHAIRKPVITIMEKDDKKLPFDVITERTIFYVNDAKGVLELKENLIKQVDKIENLNCDEIDNPIFSALESTLKEKEILGKINTSEPIDKNAIEYIISRLDRIENEVKNKNNQNKRGNKINVMIRFDIHDSNNESDSMKLIFDSFSKEMRNFKIGSIIVNNIIYYTDVISLSLVTIGEIHELEIVFHEIVQRILRDAGCDLEYKIKIVS